MNPWTRRSVELANDSDYLDRLHKVYPITPNESRHILEVAWNNVKSTLSANNNVDLLNALLDLELFPIKHTFVAYMKKDRKSLERNPNTVNRIAKEIRKYGQEHLKMCSAPKETNRQSPMFGKWVETPCLHGRIKCTTIDAFCNQSGNRYLVGSDTLKKGYIKHNPSQKGS